jgi:AraC-like DNA-binding protein
MEKHSQKIHIDSVATLHAVSGFGAPRHPLITVLDAAEFVITKEQVGVPILNDLFYIALKDGSCGMEYGRNQYDFTEGVLIFTSPHQVMTATKEQHKNEVEGWMLFFHPDLIRKSPLADTIRTYGFFSYDVHEALHLSEEEVNVLTAVAMSIKHEYGQRIDDHSQEIIVSSLQLLLNYCSRFYQRQFNTRTNLSKDIVAQVDRVIVDYYEGDQVNLKGPITIEYIAQQVHLSKNYLSDLLKKETGRSAKYHINDFVVDKAKTMLLAGDESVSEVAYSLGFNYPHYFSRLFKGKTGLTPQEFRDRR